MAASGVLFEISQNFAIEKININSYLLFIYIFIVNILNMISKTKRVITSVKIPETLYEDFKITSIRTKMNLQDIVERTMSMYLTDSGFRAKMHEQYNTYYTGSSLINAIK